MTLDLASVRGFPFCGNDTARRQSLSLTLEASGRNATTQARHVIIHGRVQGVGFRFWTQDEALARGLAGWVRNRRDGTVEAVIAGPPEAVEAMCAALRQGPPAAYVSQIEVDGWTGDIPAGFDQRPTV
jgi:acylphosphatase